MRRTRSLEDVARLTRQPVERLREWCATGLLACDRVDGAWALAEDELPSAYALSAVGPRLASGRLPDGTSLIVIAFRDHRDARHALEEIRTRTGVHPSDVELAPLSIDGMPRVLVAGRVPTPDTERIAAIVVECGGQLVDGAETLGDGAMPAGADDANLDVFSA